MSTDNYFDSIIIGGGLAGLTTAAKLSTNGQKVLLLEKGLTGGRAASFDIKGFHFNFGAHAIYGRDQSFISKLEKELNLNLEWRDFSPNKANYDLGEFTTVIPANLTGLLKTKVLDSSGKFQFAWEIIKTVIHLEKGDPHISLEKWMDIHNYKEDVRDMFLTLASSNFFTREPEKIPSDVFFNYYKRIFKTQKPVSYLQGGWRTLINELIKVIEENGGKILNKTKIQNVEFNGNKIDSITDNKDNGYLANDFIFCIPPNELLKVFKESKIEDRIKVFTHYLPSYVMYYDIGLSQKIQSPYTYIYDKNESVFLTDISYYDKTCTPEGGQLIQSIAYLKNDDIGNKEKFEYYKNKIENLFDKYFEGWRDYIVVNRISKQAIVQEIKWTIEQEAMPIFFPEIRNLFFAGDWCKGEGQLSELSFSTGYQASSYILEKNM